MRKPNSMPNRLLNYARGRDSVWLRQRHVVWRLMRRWQRRDDEVETIRVVVAEAKESTIAVPSDYDVVVVAVVDDSSCGWREAGAR